MFQIFILFSIICFINSTPIQKSVDWRTKGAVQPVQDQGSCDHSTVLNALDALSARKKIDGGNLIQLSAQQVYDCAGNWCPCGSAGSATQVYDSIMNVNVSSVDSEKSYPFTGKCDHKCKFTKSSSAASLWAYEAAGRESDLYNMVIKGPVVVTIEASTDAFQLYTGGIFDDSSCKGDAFDHTLLVVGYGTENGVDYWIARNSWDKNWGEQGYIRTVGGKTMCGIGREAVLPFAGSA